MKRYIPSFLYLLILLCMLSLPAEARKKVNKYDLKRENASNIPLIEPDAVAHKSKPDSHPKGVKQPSIHVSDVEYLHGLDMSHYQGRIDWKGVAEDPHAGFIYLKATEGSGLVDDTYEYNIKEARKAGLKVGSYHFFRPAISAEKQFENFKSVVERKKQDLIPLVDVEVTARGVSRQLFHQRLEEFLNLITKEYGQRPMIYTGQNFYNKHFANSRFQGYKFMIAAYTLDEPVLDNDDDYLIWQYTGKGSVKGVRGHVDMSRFRGRHTLSEILYK